MSNQLLRFFLLLILVLFNGCSATDHASEDEISDELPSSKVEIFAARGQLGGTLYEKYVLSGDSLWRECGSLAKKPTVTINPLETQADLVDPKTLKKLRNSLAKVPASEKSNPLPPPDSPFGIATAGAFEMTIAEGDNIRKFTTSVDAVSGAKSPQLKFMNRMFILLRSVGQPICGGGTFFGM